MDRHGGPPTTHAGLYDLAEAAYGRKGCLAVRTIADEIVGLWTDEDDDGFATQASVQAELEALGYEL